MNPEKDIPDSYSDSHEKAIRRYFGNLERQAINNSFEVHERRQKLFYRLKGEFVENQYQTKALEKIVKWAVHKLESRSENIFENGTILDDGCGTGGITLELKKRGHKIIGLEPDGTLLSIAQTRSSGGTKIWIQGVGEQLPFHDKTFTMVLSKSVFEHVTDQRYYLQEIYRVLKPGGIGIFFIPNAWWFLEHHGRFLMLPFGNSREQRFLKYYGIRLFGNIRPPHYHSLLKFFSSLPWKILIRPGNLCGTNTLPDRLISYFLRKIKLLRYIGSDFFVAVKK